MWSAHFTLPTPWDDPRNQRTMPEARSCRRLRLRTNQSFLGKTRLEQQILYGLDHLYSKYHLWRCRELNQEYPILIYIPCRKKTYWDDSPIIPHIILYGLRVLAQACQNSIRCWSWKGDSPANSLQRSPSNSLSGKAPKSGVDGYRLAMIDDRGYLDNIPVFG